MSTSTECRLKKLYSSCSLEGGMRLNCLHVEYTSCREKKGSLRKKKRKEKNDLVEEVGKENGLENVGSETEEFWKSKKEKKVRFGE